MSNKLSNFPNAQLPDVAPGEMALAISEQLELAKWEHIDISQSGQIRDRLETYFKWCIEKDHKPHVEEMALALGVTRQTLWNWQQQGGERGEVISLAKQLLASLHESWGLNGKLNPATFCFIAKNHYGYSDNVSIEVSPHNNNRPVLSQEEIHQIADQTRRESIRDIIDGLPD